MEKKENKFRDRWKIGTKLGIFFYQTQVLLILQSQSTLLEFSCELVWWLFRSMKRYHRFYFAKPIIVSIK